VTSCTSYRLRIFTSQKTLPLKRHISRMDSVDTSHRFYWCRVTYLPAGRILTFKMVPRLSTLRPHDGLQFDIPFYLKFDISFYMKFDIPFCSKFDIPFCLKFDIPFDWAYNPQQKQDTCLTFTDLPGCDVLSTDGGCVVTGIWIQPSDVVMVVAVSSVGQHYWMLVVSWSFWTM
jgi:hypothetical protein